MQVNGPIPFRAAQAYGIVRPPSAGPTPAGTEHVPGANSAGDASGPQAARPSTAPVQADLREELIAGHVAGGVDFTGGVPVAGSSLSLYTRAADRVEAATAVSIGRTLDLRA